MAQTVSDPFTLRVNAPAKGLQDFITRRSAPGVIRWFGFDSAADLGPGLPAPSGDYGRNFGTFFGAGDVIRPTLDSSVKASGNSSLKITVPANFGPEDPGGSWFCNFSSDYSQRFTQNAEFYIQWRQRFDANFINSAFGGYITDPFGVPKTPSANSWKMMIIGAGDISASGPFMSSCNSSNGAGNMTLIVQNTENGQGLNPLLQMYQHTCFTGGGGCSTGGKGVGVANFYTRPGSPEWDLQFQPGGEYSALVSSQPQGYPNAFHMVANEWMTFQLGVRTGPRSGDHFVGSNFKLWAQREGQPSHLVIDYTWDSCAYDSANENLGKVWLTAFMTRKSSATPNPASAVWYDELIISTQRIADAL